MQSKRKRIWSVLLSLALALSLVPAFSMTALATDNATTYTLQIPATLNVSTAGWNATDGISATGSLASGKKLTVTASSANSWALKSGENTVGYNLATATGTYSNSATPASWEFTELTNTATTKPMGIIVEDYNSKPAGNYQDTVTFTAKVEDAVTTVTWNNNDITGSGKSFTKDGVTITAGNIEFDDKNFMMGGTFTTTLGNFTKIEVTAQSCGASGTGWSGSSTKKTWTGNASRVSFSGNIMGMGMSNLKFVFTIVPTN